MTSSTQASAEPAPAAQMPAALISGTPGRGKSSALAWLQAQALSQGRDLVVLDPKELDPKELVVLDPKELDPKEEDLTTTVSVPGWG